jgi:hypothetical protein
MSEDNSVGRFAHPFYTTTPPDQRPIISGVGQRMTDYVAIKLEKIPKPQRKPVMTLEEVIGTQGAAEIENFGSITFHAVGDTGHEDGEMQQMVADAMTADYDITHPEKSPAFFLHLGDVNYYNNTDLGYHAQFYEPYKKYPGKIIAIPGNHDGELFKYDATSTGQKVTLEAFQKNFCQPTAGIPPAAGTIYREMVSQPGVYWLLDAPFINIIGLYSNVAEGPGFISASSIGTKQKNWLVQILKSINKQREQGKRKALVIAVHHPPVSAGGHHSSHEMLTDIDDACHKGGLMPDAVLAAHAHNYQRFTRNLAFNNKDIEIPFFVAGCGGRGLQPVSTAYGNTDNNFRFENSLSGYGYLTLTATNNKLTIFFTHVDKNVKKSFDNRVVVDLTTNKLL